MYHSLKEFIMKYCLRFNKNSKYLDTVDELKIKVTPKHTEASLLKFLESRPEQQRVLIDLSELTTEEVEKIYTWRVADVHASYAFVILPDHPRPVAPFFYNYPVNTWDKLVGCVKAGASDVYITDELGFDLSKVSDYCVNHNVLIRVYPNIAQSSSILNSTHSLQKFFIRPEDEYVYNNYVNVYEFAGDMRKQDIIYKIYASHDWYGPLSLIIEGFTEIVANNMFLPYFPATRIKCQKRCLQDRCNACMAMKDFGVSLGTQMTVKVVYPENYKGVKDNDIITAEKLAIVEEDFDN